MVRPLARQIPVLLLSLGLQGAAPEVPTDILALMNTPIQVSSTQPEHLLSSPSTVTILDRGFIARYNFETLADLLNTVTGMEVIRSNASHDVVTSRSVLQDHYTTKVLLLIDGIPTWNAVTGSGQMALYRIDPRDVERIEVLRGPASVLYGSNAYVGAVNIVLRRTWNQEGEVRLTQGSRGSQGSGGRLSGAVGDLQYVFCGNRQDLQGATYGFTGEDGATVPFKDILGTRSGLLRLDYGNHALLLSAFRHTETALGGITTIPTGLGREWSEFGHLAAYTYTGRAGDLGMQAKAAFDRSYRDTFITQDATDNDHYDSYRQSLGLKLSWLATRHLDLEFGGDFERRHSTSGTNRSSATPSGIEIESIGMENRSVTERSLFLQGNWRDEALTVVAGTRFTDNALAGSNLSSRVTAVYTLNDRHAVKAIAGQSFRAPTLFEFYAAVPGVVSGNPSLKAEKASSVELAYVGSFGQVLLQAVVYHAWYINKIERLGPDPATGTYTYGNGGTFQADALELEFKWQGVGNWRGFANFDWLLHSDEGDKVRDASSSLDHYNFKYPPRYHLRSGLSYSAEGFHASALASLTGPCQGPVGRIPTQWTSSVNAGYAHGFGGVRLDHVISLINLNDRITLYPNYTRRTLDALPQDDMGRRWNYTLKINF